MRWLFTKSNKIVLNEDKYQYNKIRNKAFLLEMSCFFMSKIVIINLFRQRIVVFFLLWFACFSLKAQTEEGNFEVVSDILISHQDTLINHQDTLTLNNNLPQTVNDTVVVPAKIKSAVVPDGVANPHKATLWALIPGGGQIYNWKHGDKCWLATLKLTAIYGGFGTLSYFIVQNSNDYRDFRDAYKWVSSEGENGKENKYTVGYTADQLKSYMDYYQTNLEWCYFFTALLYGLQIVEATVTAHLLTFDVSDNLALSVKTLYLPDISSSSFLNSTFGLSLCYKVPYK